jgi:hypothetical protein
VEFVSEGAMLHAAGWRSALGHSLVSAKVNEPKAAKLHVVMKFEY